MSQKTDPREHLPLRPVEFEILLVLKGGDSHGYAIIKEAEARWPGEGHMETGTLYRALRRLTQAGLVRPSDRRPAPDADDQRRRYFTITPLGEAVAAAEAERLAAQVEVARTRDLLPEAGGGAS
jgi:DNA-binding PadR family transcriptional regulator